MASKVWGAALYLDHIKIITISIVNFVFVYAKQFVDMNVFHIKFIGFLLGARETFLSVVLSKNRGL